MICRRCLHRATAIRSSSSLLARSVSTTISPRPGPPAATSTIAAQPFSTPLSPAPNAVSLGTNLKPKAKVSLPTSAAPAGTTLKGLNYFKGREDPIALAEEEYPEWLWHCLDAKSKDGGEDEMEGDEFSKSKKQRRAAAKRQKKMEAQRLASGESLQPKIPLTQQTIDLPSNEEGSVEGALDAAAKREDLRKAMRGERRAKIKENNFLTGMR